MFFTTTTVACTTASWSGASGLVVADDPNNSVSRINGFCGLEVTGTGYVQDNSPAAETSFISRFYFFPEFTSSGSTDIFVAYSNEAATTAAITIRYDGTNIILDATAIGGTTASVAASSGWNVIEFAWGSGTTGNLWVNANATTDPASATFTSGTGSIEAVRLGSPNGFGGFAGKATFDDYVSQRTEPVGSLLIGDANGSGGLSIADVITLFNELSSNAPVLASGQADCNLSGSITIADVICYFNL